MKKQNNKILLIIIAFFVGVISTIVIYKYYPGAEKEVLENVTITSNETINKSIEQVYDSVVVIQTFNNNQLLNTGTGFVYKKDESFGYIITNDHVVDKTKTVKVTNNNNLTVEATVLGGDQYVDIAVLKVPVSSVMKVAKIGDSLKTVIGDTVFTVGSPMGIEYQGTVTKGILSGTKREVEVSLSGGGKFMMELLQTDAAINPGNSGGPLVNIMGEVIGVNSMKFVQQSIEGMGFAIPIEMVTSAVTFLEQGKAIERPVFGATVTDVNDIFTMRQYNINIPNNINEGAVIIEVEQDYPAGKSGFKVGDIVLKIDDQKVTSTAKFRTILYSHKVGETIKITYNRNGEEKTTDVKLDKKVN